MKIYKNLIIGGGAAGLFLAINLKPTDTIILEKNSKFGAKILASGGGRCNITNRNLNSQKYLGNSDFIDKTLKNLSFEKILDFFSELNFKEEKHSQFYCENGSKAVLNVILKQIKCEKRESCEVLSVSKILNKNIFEILTTQGKFYAKNLIVATGGLSYKILGATGIGYDIAKFFNLEVATPRPALVGFTAQKNEFWFKHLSGVSLPVILKVGKRNFKDNLLFTHKGISGPAVLNASLFWQKGQISLNFAPNFRQNELKGSKKQVSTLLNLPKSFTKEFLNAINLKDMQFNKYNNSEKEQFLRIFNYIFAPAGTFGFDRAEITKGGIKTHELTENFESKKVKNLYFIGEVLDVSGMVGGYNLHFAFASAKTASFKLNKT